MKTLCFALLLVVLCSCGTTHTSKLPSPTVLSALHASDSAYLAQRASGVPYSEWYWEQRDALLRGSDIDSVYARPLVLLDSWRTPDSLGTIPPTEYTHLKSIMIATYQSLEAHK